PGSHAGDRCVPRHGRTQVGRRAAGGLRGPRGWPAVWRCFRCRRGIPDREEPTMTTPTGPAGLIPGPVVLTSVVPGYAVIPAPTPLTFLNYYDGKFLRASDLRQEQLGIQSMIQLSNQTAGAPGLAYGFDVTLGS